MTKLFSIAFIAACAAKQPTPPTTHKPTIVLVHGAFADTNAWLAVKPKLEAKGYTVIAPNLPAHGDDKTPLAGLSMDSYVAAIGKVVAEQPGKVTLVGHSMAGVVVSGVAEQHPDKIERLVYIAAFIPKSDQPLDELANGDKASEIGPNMVFAPDYSSVTIKKEAVVDAVAADLSPDIQKLISETQKPEPLAPFKGKVTLTGKFDAIPKFYISTTQDHAVTPGFQKQMIDANGSVRKIVTVDAGHLPMIGKPDEIVTAIDGFISGK